MLGISMTRFGILLRPDLKKVHVFDVCTREEWLEVALHQFGMIIEQFFLARNLFKAIPWRYPSLVFDDYDPHTEDVKHNPWKILSLLIDVARTIKIIEHGVVNRYQFGPYFFSIRDKEIEKISVSVLSKTALATICVHECQNEIENGVFNAHKCKALDILFPKRPLAPLLIEHKEIENLGIAFQESYESIKDGWAHYKFQRYDVGKELEKLMYGKCLNFFQRLFIRSIYETSIPA